MNASGQELPAPGGVPDPLPGTPVTVTFEVPTIAWTVDISAAPIVSPIITPDRVIVATLPGSVAGYHREDGRELWRLELMPQASLATDDALLFVPGTDAVHAIRTSDGAVAWRSPSPPITAPLVVKEGWLIVATEGQLTARRANDGSVVWTIDTDARPTGAAIAGNVLFVAAAGARLIARDLADGHVLWEQRLGGDPGQPLVVGDKLFVGASDKQFYCVDAISGRIEWWYPVRATIRGAAATDGYRIFFTALDNLVRALDRSNGRLHWHKGVPFRPITGPFVAGGSVFVAGPGSDVRVLNATTGADAGRITFPDRQTVAPAFHGTEATAVFAVVTGSLAESWKLTLTLPVTVRPVSR